MLIPIQGRETLRHICDGMTEKHADHTQPMKIFIHDVHAYITDGNECCPNRIKFCPYCGVEIDSEPRP